MSDDPKKQDEPTQDEKSENDQKDIAQEYLDGWKRERAAFENYKKDEMERLAQSHLRMTRGFLAKLLPILDSFELALKSTPEEAQKSDWFTGYALIKKQFEEMLKNEGIEVIETKGKDFNPYEHEAIEKANDNNEGAQPFVVEEELQKGYKIGDYVLRPARVRVGKKSGGETQ